MKENTEVRFSFEPMTEYRVVSIESSSIEDLWEEGHVGDFQDQLVDWIKVSPTEFLSDMVEAIKGEFFYCPTFAIDVYEDKITIEFLADENGCEASQGQTDEWMKGNLQLWNHKYEFLVERVTVESNLDLQEILTDEKADDFENT